ncbi:helix-turn-helix transcriptional regulator [Rhodococcus zopfii]|uniref:Helix-turn-helix transcriptional regulator n=1 Tax=Rhodococcus zopfii TaxID=43772 RepID=A0ABU3WSU0_9NOCA|nr:helix-turn-helix transcriptional regulator [Rhodococcus zopfii]
MPSIDPNAPISPPSSIERRPNHETSCCQEILTNREAEILRLLLTGMSNAAIAAHLFVSVETVRTHVTSVLRKYRASNRAELIARHGHSDL